MMGYMEGLAMFEEGETTEVESVRAGESWSSTSLGTEYLWPSRCSTAPALGPVRKVRTA